MKKINAVIIIAISLFLVVPFANSNAEEYSKEFYEVNYYEIGMDAIQKNEYTKAIEYLQKALNKEPQNSYIRNNLAVAYTSRGTYYYNKNISLEKAADDYRRAIYYLAYYDRSPNTPTITENITIANNNLDSVLAALKAKTDETSRLKKAKELRGKGDLAASVIEYVNASKDRKYAYESYVALGDVMKILSNEYNAAVYYDKALALKSDDATLHLKLGRTLNNLGNIDTAVRELDIASENAQTKNDALALLEVIWKERISKNPKDPVALMNLGAVYQKKGNYTMATMQYKIAQSIDPKNQMIRLNMATLLQEQGNYIEALTIYNDILKNRPNDVIVNSYKAITLDKMGKKDEAIIIYQNLLLANPNNKNVKNSLLEAINTAPDAVALNYLSKLASKLPNDADIVYAYAYTLHKNNKYNDALVWYEKALKLNDKNLDTYLNMANLYKHNHNNGRAMEVLAKANNIFPNNDKIMQLTKELEEEESFVLIEKATNLYNNKDYNDAIITYKAIKHPTEDVYLGIGACYQAMERYDEAIANYNKAVSIDSSNPNVHYFLGLANLYKKDYAKAEAALKKAMQLDSVNPDIVDAYKSVKFAQSEEYMNKGISLLDNNKLDDAIINFNHAINQCAENGYAYYYRALAYDAKGQNTKAIPDYKKALDLNHELTMAYYSMALSYEAQNNISEAKKMYQKFLSTNKQQDEYTNYAKQRLTEL